VPKIIGIEHIVLHVGDLDKSKPFYDALLGFLGFKLEWGFDRVAGWDNGDTARDQQKWSPVLRPIARRLLAGA
jgi:catechol 2,3-dioxygenase-like lactoylglutathione lyase family enzyme